MEQTRESIYWRRRLAPRRSGHVNVGGPERIASAVAGALLAGAGLRLRGPARIAASALGGLALARAATGHSRVYGLAGVSSARLEDGAGIDIDENLTIAAPVAEVYGRWADLTLLPRYMRFVRSVTTLAPGVTHWVVATPLGRRTLEFDAEVIEQRENEVLAWHTLPGQQVEHSGSVHFREVPGRGTELQLKLRFVPPGGAAGFAVARLALALERQSVAEELRRFKSIAEVGEAPTTEGQPSGRSSAREHLPKVATAPVKQRVEPRAPIGEV